MSKNETTNELKELIKDSFKEVINAYKNSYINNDLMNMEELIRDLPFETTSSTIYTWVHQNNIPYKKFRGKLLFSRKEIQQWLNDGLI